jgi:uncharacterized surface protein with fasciclin (FAS1) repeats
MKKTVIFGGSAIYPSKYIVENALISKDHTTLVSTVKVTGLVAKIKAGGSKATITTAAGAQLTLSLKGKKVQIMDTSGGKADITTADLNQRNV